MNSQSIDRASRTRFIVASTVMLSFVSFWRASSIVLGDLGSSAYYVGGIAEEAIGKSAPWFILAIMLFSYAVRAVYIESCSMFVRGGVYRVVHEALGRPAAKFSVSALMFDYVLTGPISAVSAGLYGAALANELGQAMHLPWLHVPSALGSVVFAVAVTCYFWLKNLRGLNESSGKALRILQITTVMVVVLIGWSLVTLVTKGGSEVPFPATANIHFSHDALGWLTGTGAAGITAVMVLIGLGHSVLAMSGEESLAQVNREIAAPKLKNLKRTGFIVFVYSLVFTSLVSFVAVAIIPDEARPKYFDNLIGGVTMYLAGPMTAKLAFHAFVVFVGVLLLSSAVNTSLIGSNGVLNRVAEDGVLHEWFRQPSRRFGTTHRIINLVAILQLATILISHGNITLLGEAYAFGVIWSFAMKALAVVVLRYTRPRERAWKVPGNIQIGKLEIPVFLIFITITLFAFAIINLLTKQVATIAGASFTAAFFLLFTLSERANRARAKQANGDEERFKLRALDVLSPVSLNVKRDNIVCAMERSSECEHLGLLLAENAEKQTDIVVLAVEPCADSGGDEPPALARTYAPATRAVFSQAVKLAEAEGRPVTLLAGQGHMLAVTFEVAQRLRSSTVVLGSPGTRSLEDFCEDITAAWARLPVPRPPLDVDVINPADGEPIRFRLETPRCGIKET